MAEGRTCENCAFVNTSLIEKDGCYLRPNKKTNEACTNWEVLPRVLPTSTALVLAEVMGMPISKPTLIKWCTRFDIGYQVGGKGGRWFIYPGLLKEMLSGKGKE
jgi:hypothetical protein